MSPEDEALAYGGMAPRVGFGNTGRLAINPLRLPAALGAVMQGFTESAGGILGQGPRMLSASGYDPGPDAFNLGMTPITATMPFAPKGAIGSGGGNIFTGKSDLWQSQWWALGKDSATTDDMLKWMHSELSQGVKPEQVAKDFKGLGVSKGAIDWTLDNWKKFNSDFTWKGLTPDQFPKPASSTKPGPAFQEYLEAEAKAKAATGSSIAPYVGQGALPKAPFGPSVPSFGTHQPSLQLPGGKMGVPPGYFEALDIAVAGGKMGQGYADMLKSQAPGYMLPPEMLTAYQVPIQKMSKAPASPYQFPRQLDLPMPGGFTSLRTDPGARLARGLEQGFDINLNNPRESVWLHGTHKPDFQAFDPAYFGQGGGSKNEEAFWFTRVPDVAAEYSNRSPHNLWSSDKSTDPLRLSQPRTIPVFTRPHSQFEVSAASHPDLDIGQERIMYDNSYFRDILEQAKHEGHRSVLFKNVRDMGPTSDQLAVFQPHDIRSVNAMFDPNKRFDPNLLSSLVAAGLLSPLGATLLPPRKGEREE